MQTSIQDITTPNFYKRLKKAENIEDKNVYVINQHSTATASVHTINLYKTHIGKSIEETKNNEHKVYICGCMKRDNLTGKEYACPGNTNSNPKFKTVCYHILRTIMEIHKGQKLILSDDIFALKDYVLTLPNKPEYVKIINRQKENTYFWGVILK